MCDKHGGTPRLAVRSRHPVRYAGQVTPSARGGFPPTAVRARLPARHGAGAVHCAPGVLPSLAAEPSGPT